MISTKESDKGGLGDSGFWSGISYYVRTHTLGVVQLVPSVHLLSVSRCKKTAALLALGLAISDTAKLSKIAKDAWLVFALKHSVHATSRTFKATVQWDLQCGLVFALKGICALPDVAKHPMIANLKQLPTCTSLVIAWGMQTLVCLLVTPSLLCCINKHFSLYGKVGISWQCCVVYRLVYGLKPYASQ